MSLRYIYLLERTSRIILLFAGSILGIYTQSQGQSSILGLPITRNFEPQEYNASSQNWQITEDARGFIYVANHFGLLEYDGNQWHVFNLEFRTGLKSISVDQNQRIYVGGQGQFGYFDADSVGNLSFTSLRSLIPQAFQNFDEVWSIFPTDDGVYFCTHKYVFIFKGGQIKVITHPTSIRYAYFCQYKLYVSGWEDGLLQLQGNQLVPVEGGHILKEKVIRAFLPLNKRDALIATHDGGLYRYNGKEIIPWKTPMSSILAKAQINCITRLNDGRLAIGTQNQGVFIMNEDGKQDFHLDKGYGLSGHTVLDTYEDALGHLWVAHSNGLTYVYLGLPFTLIDERVGIKGAGYAAIEHEGHLYVGTSTGAFKQEGTQFVEMEGSAGQVYHFSEQKGQLLMGHHTGPHVLRGEKFDPLYTLNGAWMFLPLREDPEYLLQGHYEGMLYYRWENGQWQAKGPVDNFDESARLFFEDGEGYIWVSHGFKGVYRLKFNEAKDAFTEQRFFKAEDGFPQSELINVFQIQNRLVFGTVEGAYVYDPASERFYPDPLLSKLIGNEARLIELEEDTQGNLYHLSGRHLGKFNRTVTGDFQVSKIQFGLLEPLISDDLENIVSIDFNRVLIASREGFICYQPHMPVITRDSISLFLREIKSLTSDQRWFGGHQKADDIGKPYRLTLPFTQRAVNIRVASPMHEGGDRINYRFRIEGFDEDWTSWSAYPAREINGLAPGTHRVWAEAKVDGLTTSQLIAWVTILPPWYQSPIAFAVYAFIGVVLLILFIGFLRNRFQRVKEELQLDKEKAIENKDMEMQKMAEASQQTIQKIQDQQLRSELAFKNQELTSSTMHLLAKNAFLQQIKDELEGMGKKSKAQKLGLSTDIRKLVSSINQNINDEEEWERFSFHFSQVHEAFFIKIKGISQELSPQELKLCAYLRMNLSTKEIAQLLNISVRGVETSRYRLRKKLGIDSKVNLVEYMMNL